MNELSGLRNENKAWQEAPEWHLLLILWSECLCSAGLGTRPKDPHVSYLGPWSHSSASPSSLHAESTLQMRAQGTFQALTRCFLSSHRAAPVSHPLSIASCLHLFSTGRGSSLAWRLQRGPEGPTLPSPALLLLKQKVVTPALSLDPKLYVANQWKRAITYYCHALILCRR